MAENQKLLSSSNNNLHSKSRIKYVGMLFIGTALIFLAGVTYRYNSENRLRSITSLSSISKASALSFSGVIGVLKDSTLEEAAFGYANHEWKVPMIPSAKFGIASNSKLFVTVALYQLQEQGIVTLSDPVSKYLDSKDLEAFGMPPGTTSYCPTLANDDSKVCQNLTIEHLLSMSSGIPDAYNCDNIPYYSRECISFDTDQWVLYKGSIASYVAEFIQSPLVFKPGKSYSYSNPNFILGAYLVEKLSGLSFQHYLTRFIFKPTGLTHTSFDPYDGSIHFPSSYVDSYRSFFEGKESASSTSTGTCRPYFTLAGFSGAGGLVSTVGDMMKWYDELFNKNDGLILSPESVAAIVKPWIKIPGSSETSYYGQGVFLEYSNASDLAAGPDQIEYCGELKCTFSCIARTRAGHIAAAFSNHAHIHLDSINLLQNQTVDALLRDNLATQTLGGASEMRTMLLTAIN